jgi:hypothetical protein
MPVKPTASENESEFISRCMSEEKSSFPDQAQRYAVCKSKWDKSNMSKITDNMSKVAAKINFEKKYEGINLAPLEKGENDPCWKDYVQVGTKMLDGKEVPNCVPLSKIEMELEEGGVNLADYPWDQCVLEQTDRYGSKDIAEKVCGAIRSKYGK